VGTSSGSFSPYSSDLSARVIQADKASNLPIKIDTYVIFSGNLNFKTKIVDVELIKTHSHPDYFGMADLSPASYEKLINQIKVDPDVAVKYLE